MKKTLGLLAVALFASATIFTSCGKYDEGPGISLRSKKARVAGDWETEKTIVDGEEETSEYDKYYTITFEKDGTGEYNWEAHTISMDGFTFDMEAGSMKMEWEFGDKKETLKTRMKFDSEWSEWDESDIIRLTEKEFWAKSDYEGDEVETHLKKKE